MKHLLALVLVSASVSSLPALASTQCRNFFKVESVEGFSDDAPSADRRGRFEFGIVQQARVPKRGGGTTTLRKQDVVAYTALKPGEPAALLLKEAFDKGLTFEACFDEKVAAQFDKEGSCADCTARGELQDLVKLDSVRNLRK